MAAAGDRIDKFTLVRQLGAGGMGETWEAVRQASHEFEQRVAIKLADPETLDCPDGLESFRREAALAASLRHPNIAAVLDIDDRAGYIVCELVDGADLRSVLRAAVGGRLDVPVLVHVVGQIARGLSHAHRRILRGRRSPVIHRDMSPGNVVVDYDGNVKIVDFGIAKACNGSDASEAIKGKLAYMAPEQAMGARMDGRVDQYALGVIAYEALTGWRPNDGADDGETLACILGGKHTPLRKRLPQLDPTLAAIIERMLERNPDDRYASMDAVLDALARFTPPFTIHRELIPLVIHARQPHTIVRENGQFISRPVEAEPLLREKPVGPASSFQERMGEHATPALRRSDKDKPSLQDRLGDPALYSGGGSLNAPALRGWAARPRNDTPGEPAIAAGSRELGLATTADASPGAGRSATSSPSRQLARALVNTLRPASSTTSASRARRRSSARVERRHSLAKRVRAWADRLLASRAFWQGLTVLGAILLALVAWVALSPDVLLSLAPAPTRSRMRLPSTASVQAAPRPTAASQTKLLLATVAAPAAANLTSSEPATPRAEALAQTPQRADAAHRRERALRLRGDVNNQPAARADSDAPDGQPAARDATARERPGLDRADFAPQPPSLDPVADPSSAHLPPSAAEAAATSPAVRRHAEVEAAAVQPAAEPIEVE